METGNGVVLSVERYNACFGEPLLELATIGANQWSVSLCALTEEKMNNSIKINMILFIDFKENLN